MNDFNRQHRNHSRTHPALSSVGVRRRVLIYDHDSEHINDHHGKVQLCISHHINDDYRNLANFYPNEEAKLRRDTH